MTKNLNLLYIFAVVLIEICIYKTCEGIWGYIGAVGVGVALGIIYRLLCYILNELKKNAE